MLIESEKLLGDLHKILEDTTPTGWETPIQYNVLNIVKDKVEECIKVAEEQPAVDCDWHELTIGEKDLPEDMTPVLCKVGYRNNGWNVSYKVTYAVLCRANGQWMFVWESELRSMDLRVIAWKRI